MIDNEELQQSLNESTENQSELKVQVRTHFEPANYSASLVDFIPAIDLNQ